MSSLGSKPSLIKLTADSLLVINSMEVLQYINDVCKTFTAMLDTIKQNYGEMMKECPLGFGIAHVRVEPK